MTPEQAIQILDLMTQPGAHLKATRGDFAVAEQAIQALRALIAKPADGDKA